MSSDGRIPVGSGYNATFPYERNAAAALRTAPPGLVVDAETMREFLHAPVLQNDWFSTRSWHETRDALANDGGISAGDEDDAAQLVITFESGIWDWAQARMNLDMSNGYAPSIPQEMRDRANAAWTAVRQLGNRFSDFSSRNSVSDATRDAMSNYLEVAWEYVECMALEVEASAEQVDVSDVRDRFEHGVSNPWQPAVTPSTLDAAGMELASRRSVLTLSSDSDDEHPFTDDDNGDTSGDGDGAGSGDAAGSGGAE